MDALVSLGKPEKAMASYQDLLDKLWETGEPPPESWMKHLRRLEDRIRLPRESDDTLRRFLWEETSPPGAYPCSLQGFRNFFHILERMRERRQVEYCILVCTIEGLGKHASASWQRCAGQGAKLEEAFRTCLRMGDIYTKYSAGQYLLLCVGSGEEGAAEIGTRVDTLFQKLCGGRYRAQLRVLDLKTGEKGSL